MKYKLLFLFLTFATKQVCCQTMFKYVTGKAIFGTPIYVKPQQSFITPYTLSSAMLVKPSFYCDNLGFFCKQEIKIQRAIKLPFVFRLGSVQAVDYLEGKRGSFITTR